MKKYCSVIKLQKAYFSVFFALCALLFSSTCSNFYYTDNIGTNIVIYGDSRTNHDIHREIVASIIQVEPEAVFHTGDLVEDGLNPDQWTIFDSIVTELIAIADFYPALGNHERNSQYYFDNFDLPNNERWYSVDIAKIHFIVLDSNSDISKSSEQYEWLENDLNTIDRDIDFVIALFHHPIFTTGWHPEDEMNFKEEIVPLFERFEVDLVFAGHNHNYERSFYNDIYYIVTGGAGAPLSKQVRKSLLTQVFIEAYHFCNLYIMENHLHIDVFDRNMILLDTLIIKARR